MIQKSRSCRWFKSSEDGIAFYGSEAKKNVLTRAQPPTEELFSRQGKWEELERFLHDKDSVYQSSTTTFAHGDSMLHMVCRYHPPTSVVRQLLNKRAPLLAVQEVNSAGQTPLHVAAACGASFQVVQLLLEHCPAIPASQDSQGNTPLHLHIANTCRRRVCDPGFCVPNLTKKSSTRGRIFNSNSTQLDALSTTASSCANRISLSSRGLLKKASKRDLLTRIKSAAEEKMKKDDAEHFKFLVIGPNQEVVYALATHSPSCLLIENYEGVSAVELAILCEADFKTVKTLQTNVSVKYFAHLKCASQKMYNDR
jgi:hypothetical protein